MSEKILEWDNKFKIKKNKKKYITDIDNLGLTLLLQVSKPLASLYRLHINIFSKDTSSKYMLCVLHA